MGLSRDLEDMIIHCNAILENAKALRRYEGMGIPTTQPPPSALIRRIVEKRDALVPQVIGDGTV